MNKLALFFLTVLAASCGQVKQIDTTDIKEIMRNSKVKRVTDKELLHKVTEVGAEISTKLNGNFRIECQNVLTLEGQRVELYNTSLLTSEQLDKSQKGQLLEVYKYGLEHNQNVGANIQTFNDTLYAYSFPIRKEAFLYTSCGNDLALVLISKTELVKQL